MKPNEGGYKPSKENCPYIQDRPDRNKVRETVWQKIVNVDSKVESVDTKLQSINDYLTSQLKEKVQHDDIQDHRHEELKAMVQELSAKIDHLSEKQEGTERDIQEFWKHIDNGWKQDFMERLVSIVETNSGYSYNLNKAECERKKIIWTKILEIFGTMAGTGGILYLILQSVL